MKWTIIYFDDQIHNIEVYKELLEDHFNIVGCQDPNLASQLIREHHPHAYLLDFHMPMLDGVELGKRIMDDLHYNGCPIFFISGDISDATKVKALQSGAVDFIPRDIRSEELILRLSNKIRHYLQRSTILELGNLRIDKAALRSTINGVLVDLTLLEMKMLGHLLRAYPEMITRTEMIKKIWGDETVKPGTINTHLTNLRPKIQNWDYTIKTREDNVFVQEKK
jgi:DNA-binding response OmpR family regulator